MQIVTFSKYVLLFSSAVVVLSVIENSHAASSAANNNGTKLTAVSEAGEVQCLNNNEASVEVTTTVTTSGAVDSAIVSASIDDDSAETYGWIEPWDFVHNKRTKTAEHSFVTVLSNGDHTVEMCYVQSGAEGRTSKATCANELSISVNCSPPVSVCANAEVFGNIVGNGNLCGGQAIPVHIKGDFGDSANLTISKDLFSIEMPVNRAGDSCVYQAQYRPSDQGDAGAGMYEFTISGSNGNSYTFNAMMKCK